MRIKDGLVFPLAAGLLPSTEKVDFADVPSATDRVKSNNYCFPDWAGSSTYVANLQLIKKSRIECARRGGSSQRDSPCTFREWTERWASAFSDGRITKPWVH